MPVVRYYLPKRQGDPHAQAPAPVAPAYGSQWNITSQATRVALLTVPVGTGVMQSCTSGVYGAGQRSLGLQCVGDALPAGPISGTVRAVFRTNGGHPLADNYASLTIRVVSNDGSVERGVLLASRHTDNESYGWGTAPRIISPTALNPVTAQAGDRLVIEVGHYRHTTATFGNAATTGVGDVAATVDVPFVDGPDEGSAEGRPWVELTLDAPPPNAPTGLVLSNPTASTIDMDWTAPVGGGPVAGYDIRVDGGAPVDVGNVLSHTVTGLDWGTSYTLGVRAYNVNGDTVWVEDDLSTLSILVPPTDLILTPSIFSIQASWTAPVTGLVPTGYLLRVNGGDAVDVGNVLTYNITGLTPSTLYEVEVRSYNLSFGEPTEFSIAIITASEQLIEHPPLFAVDGDLDTSWKLRRTSGWLQAELFAPQTIGSYKIRAGAGAGADPDMAPRNWQLAGSDNGWSWYYIDTRTAQSWVGGEEKTFDVLFDWTFKYYTLSFTANNGAPYTAVQEFSLFSPTPQTYLESEDELSGSTTTLNDGLNNLYLGDSTVAALYVGASPVPRAYFADTLTFEL